MKNLRILLSLGFLLIALFSLSCIFFLPMPLFKIPIINPFLDSLMSIFTLIGVSSVYVFFAFSAIKGDINTFEENKTARLFFISGGMLASLGMLYAIVLPIFL